MGYADDRATQLYDLISGGYDMRQQEGVINIRSMNVGYVSTVNRICKNIEYSVMAIRL